MNQKRRFDPAIGTAVGELYAMHDPRTEHVLNAIRRVRAVHRIPTSHVLVRADDILVSTRESGDDTARALIGLLIAYRTVSALRRTVTRLSEEGYL